MRASSYWADMSSSNPVAMGPDGNLIHEFMEMERIILEQSQSIGSESYPLGSYQPYVCRVAGIIGNMGFNHECLDIASPKTLSTRSNGSNTNIWNTSYTTNGGLLNANVFVHTNVMVDISDGANMIDSDVMDLFGYNTTDCSSGDVAEGKIMGDGVINSFDLYVLASAQFKQGPYANIGDIPFSEVPTTRGRPDTKDRCCLSEPNCPNFNRLEWQQRYAWKPCYSYSNDEADYLQRGRRLQNTPGFIDHDIFVTAAAASGMLAFAPVALFKNNRNPVVEESSELLWAVSHSKDNTNVGSQDSLVGWSPYGLYNPYNETHALPVPTMSAASTYNAESLGGGTEREMQDLGAKVFEYDVTAQGTWYWINIPSVHLSLELTLSSLGLHDPVSISNDRPPDYMENRIPYKPEKYNLRFMRHREFYRLDTSNCAIVQSSRLSSNAMENGVIYIGQSLAPGKSLCGFDLMLWKPSGAYGTTGVGDPVCIVSGSTSMSGTGGSIQYTTQCAVQATATSIPPPQPSPSLLLASPPQAPVPTNTMYSVSLVVNITNTTTFGSQSRSRYKDALLAMISEKVGSNDTNVTLTVTLKSLTVTATATFRDFDSANNTRNNFQQLSSSGERDQLAKLMNITDSNHITGVKTGDVTTVLHNLPPPPPAKQKNNSWLDNLARALGIIFSFGVLIALCLCQFYAHMTPKSDVPTPAVTYVKHSSESMPLMTMNPVSIMSNGRR